MCACVGSVSVCECECVLVCVADMAASTFAHVTGDLELCKNSCQQNTEV